MNDRPPQHDRVIHPRELLATERRRIAKANDFLLTHLAVIFGLAWTVWVFMFVTVAAYWMPAGLQGKIFFFSSGCIQLFALPLLVYVGNKVQKSQDAQSDVQHQALTHIATVGDDVKTLIEQNNTLTADIHKLVSAPKPPAPPRARAAAKDVA